MKIPVLFFLAASGLLIGSPADNSAVLSVPLLPVPDLLADEVSRPGIAEFIPAKARIYFNGSESLLYWGGEEETYRVAITTAEALNYVTEGGHGEAISVGIPVFTSSSHWGILSRRGQHTVQVAVFADGLEPFIKRLESKAGSLSSNDHGTWWGHGAVVSLHELKSLWGRVPETVRVRAMLADADLPHAVSGAVTVKLKPLAKSEVSLSQRARSVRIGQSRQEVLALLGEPVSQGQFFPGEGKEPEVALNFQDLQAQNTKLGRILIVIDRDDRVTFVMVGDLC